MSWDQPDFSFDNGQPPTPTRTPTSPSFNDLFQTPRMDSSFLDSKSSWNGAEGSNNYADILKTPRALLFSTSNAASPAMPSKQLSEGPNLEPPLVSNAEKLLSTPSFEGLQADKSPRIGLSPIFAGKSPYPSGERDGLSLNTSTSFRSASSMQTPPPTSTSATKRKGTQTDGRKPASKSANERRMSVPIAPKPQIQTTPSQIEGADQNQDSLFSPSVFGYDFTSPQTAPAYPQAKILWGSDDPSGGNLDFLNQTPGLFGTPRQSQDPFGFNDLAKSTSEPHSDASGMHFSDQPDHGLNFNQPAFASSAQSQKEKYSGRSYGNAVNPSLLFSSPSKRSGQSERLGTSNRVLSEDSLQPYAYQMQEAKRDRASMGIAKVKKRRKPSVDSPAVQAALETLRDDGTQRPQFRRSMTDSSLPTLNRNTQISSASLAQGRSSPLKRNRDTLRKAKRTSVALTVDANGRARTETRVVEDSEGSDNDRMEVDHHSDESDSSSSGGSDMIVVPKTAMPRLGRFSNSASHSKKSSYTSMYSSNSYQEDPKLPELKDRPSTSGAHSRFSGKPLQPLKEASFGTDNGQQGDTAMDSDGEDRTAQAELRKMAQQRRQTGLRTASLYTGGYGELHDASLNNLSPTTITDPGLATPTSGQSTASGGIRCVCNIAVDDGQMIQCESCRNWLHVPCTGLQAMRLPTIYLCLFCTGSTPVARGGRVRDPSARNSGGGFRAPTSPLAHKGARFR